MNANFDDEFLLAHSAAIIASSNDAIIGKSLDQIIVSWNNAAEAIFGYKKAEVLGKSIDLIIPSDLVTEEIEILEKIHNGEHIDHFETVRIRKNQEHFPVSVSISPIRNASGEIIGASKILRDISELKKAEIQGRENRFRVLLNTITDSVVMIEENGNIQTLNPAAVKMFGYSSSELQGKNVNVLMPEPYASEHHDYLHRYLTTGDRKIIGIGREVVGKRKDGSTFPMELAVSEMEVNGERMFTGIVRDITQRKACDSALYDAKEQAIAANKAKSEFLSCMSHELRTPLNAILGYAQLFLMESDLSAEHWESANEIQRAGDHLLTLISDLIDLSRIETGKVGITLETISVAKAINDALQMLVPLAHKQDISLVNEVRVGDEITVTADAVRLHQVIINLLSNAIKYNREGGSVALSCKAIGNMARITVVDTGQGIPHDKMSRVFTCFDRLGRESGRIEGTGIGLVLTKRIVEAMNGRVGFDSIEGVGSTFWVELPLAESYVTVKKSEDLTDSELLTVEKQGKLSSKQKMVLHIEDNPLNLRLMRQIMAKHKDFELCDAQTAELGIELARANPPTLIVTDINLPGMSGHDALKHFKADPKMKHIPIIAVSADAMNKDLVLGKDDGFDAYLTKPFDVLEFLLLVDKLTKK